MVSNKRISRKIRAGGKHRSHSDQTLHRGSPGLGSNASGANGPQGDNGSNADPGAGPSAEKTSRPKRKNPHAQALGRKGGLGCSAAKYKAITKTLRRVRREIAQGLRPKPDSGRKPH